MRQNSFKRTYLKKVALGEGCGCAEQVITNHNLEAAAEAAQPTAGGIGIIAAVRIRLRRWIGHRPDPT